MYQLWKTHIAGSKETRLAVSIRVACRSVHLHTKQTFIFTRATRVCAISAKIGSVDRPCSLASHIPAPGQQLNTGQNTATANLEPHFAYTTQYFITAPSPLYPSKSPHARGAIHQSICELTMHINHHKSSPCPSLKNIVKPPDIMVVVKAIGTISPSV